MIRVLTGANTTMLIHGLGLLCALAAATFAATPIGAHRGRIWPAVAAGFVGAAVWLQPDPTSVGLLVAVVAGVQLVRPRRGWLLIASGLVAGLWASLLGSQGFPTIAAWLVAAGLIVATAWLAARREGFAPTILREEALLAMCGLGIVVATGPTISAGWGSAGVMNLEPAGGVRQALGLWVIMLGGASIALGGWHSLRRRR